MRVLAMMWLTGCALDVSDAVDDAQVAVGLREPTRTSEAPGVEVPRLRAEVIR